MDTNGNRSNDINPMDCYTVDITNAVEPYDEIDFSSYSFDNYDDWYETICELENLLAYLDRERLETQKYMVEQPGELFVFNFLF